MFAVPAEDPKPEPEAAPAPKPKGPLQLRAESLLRRRPETPLTSGESRAFSKNKACIEATSESEWIALEAFYSKENGSKYARKDLATILNNWNGEIDRARGWKPGESESESESRTERLREFRLAKRELESLGKLSDHTENSKSWLRVKELRAHIEMLRSLPEMQGIVV